MHFGWLFAFGAPFMPYRDGLSPEDHARLVFFEILTSIYLFTLGATVGSFLNVVAYRMPLGLGLLWPPSRCPACETRIRLRDNIPLLSWLALRGRCRACGTSISPRYFLVEALAGTLFLLLGHLELLSGGANLPLRAPNPLTGLMWVLWETKWDLVRIYLYHCAMLSILLALALIRLDGNRLPARLVVVSLSIGLGFPLWWSDLRPVPATAGVAWNWQSSLVTGLCGAAAGATLGAVLAAAWQLRVAPRQFGAMAALAVVGSFLGWQAAISAGALAACGLLPVAIIARWRLRNGCLADVTCLGLAAVVQLLLWRRLSDVAWWPGPASGWPSNAIAITGSAALAYLAGAIHGQVPVAPADDLACGSAAPDEPGFEDPSKTSM